MDKLGNVPKTIREVEFTGCDGINSLTVNSARLSLATLMWTCLFFAVRINTRMEPEPISRVIAMLHAIIVSTVGGYLCFSKSNYQISTLAKECMTEAHFTLFTISFGYFLYDLAFCIWYGEETRLMIVHHAISVISLLRVQIRTKYGTLCSCSLAAFELTNPLLQLRWFIRSADLGKTLLFYTVEAVFISSFIIIRGVVCSFFAVKILMSSFIDIEFKVLVILFHIISFGFINNMIKYISYKYFKSDCLRVSITRLPQGVPLEDSELPIRRSVTEHLLPAGTPINEHLLLAGRPVNEHVLPSQRLASEHVLTASRSHSEHVLSVGIQVNEHTLPVGRQANENILPTKKNS